VPEGLRTAGGDVLVLTHEVTGPSLEGFAEVRGQQFVAIPGIRKRVVNQYIHDVGIFELLERFPAVPRPIFLEFLEHRFTGNVLLE